MVNTILRFFSYLYHLALILFLLILGTFGLFGTNKGLSLKVLPWEDPALSYWLFFGSLICLGLAAAGKLKLPFRLWTVVVFVLMVRGFFLTSYYLGDFFQTAVLITLGALIALYGSWTSTRRRNA